MDNKDRLILEALMKNSRTPMTAIASELGVTETAVRKRIRKLERNGIIKAYTALIDPFYLGYEGVALVGVDTAPEKILDVFESLKRLSNVRYAALTSGDHMIMFEVWCKTPEELNLFLGELGETPGVTRVCPAVFMKRVE
ncbi:AsnC family transcriptional regulator [Candidatus Micrarchaeota archaeon]|nr:AsnC family transcriptional regulator [Candidatus Micrarchaeota archaeon]